MQLAGADVHLIGARPQFRSLLERLGWSSMLAEALDPLRMPGGAAL